MMSDGVRRRPVWIVAAAASCAVALAGCESTRFAGRGPSASATRPLAPDPGPDPIASAVPSGSVSSEPLAPPSGPAAVADVPVMPGSPRQVETLGGSGGGGGGQAPPVSTRSAAIGGWTAREASGTSCRINLSSTPSLDLYRASASGCANKDLARITAWDFRDGEVYLYQPGGSVAARLRPATGSLSGVLSKSGAPLTLSRG